MPTGKAASGVAGARARANPPRPPPERLPRTRPPPSAGPTRDPRCRLSHANAPSRLPTHTHTSSHTHTTGVRNAYAAHADGATGYYVDSGATYSNPHERGVREALFRCVRARPHLFFDDADRPSSAPSSSAASPRATDSVPPVRILDLSCGSGEATAALIDAGVRPDAIDAFDPYTRVAFERRFNDDDARRRVAATTTPSTAVSSGDDSCVLVDTPLGGRDADVEKHARSSTTRRMTCEGYSFEDIARGAVADRRWRTVVCSFAMHLCARDFLPTLCVMLACSAEFLVILTPHKRPAIEAAWGWHLIGEERDAEWRVRTRVYATDAERALEAEAEEEGGSSGGEEGAGE